MKENEYYNEPFHGELESIHIDSNVGGLRLFDPENVTQQRITINKNGYIRVEDRSDEEGKAGCLGVHMKKLKPDDLKKLFSITKELASNYKPIPGCLDGAFNEVTLINSENEVFCYRDFFLLDYEELNPWLFELTGFEFL